MDKIPGQFSAETNADGIIALDGDRAAVRYIARKIASGRNSGPAGSGGKWTVDIAVIIRIGRAVGFIEDDLAGRCIGDRTGNARICQNAGRVVGIVDLDRAFVGHLIVAVEGDRDARCRLDRARRRDPDIVSSTGLDRCRANRGDGGCLDLCFRMSGDRHDGKQAGGAEQIFAHKNPLVIVEINVPVQTQDGIIRPQP